MQCEQVRCFLESWIQARVITVEFLQRQPLAVTGLAAELDLAVMAPSSLCTNAVLGSAPKSAAGSRPWAQPHQNILAALPWRIRNSRHCHAKAKENRCCNHCTLNQTSSDWCAESEDWLRSLLSEQSRPRRARSRLSAIVMTKQLAVAKWIEQTSLASATNQKRPPLPRQSKRE